MKAPLAALLTALLLLPAISGAQSVVTECTQADLEAKIFAARTNGGNGVVTFNCDGVIQITNTIRLRYYPAGADGMTNAVILDATGHGITFSGPTTTNLTNASRLFFIESGVAVGLINATVANARDTNGAAFWVNTNAALVVGGCFFSNNIAIGSNGISGASASTNSTPSTGRNGGSGTAGMNAMGGVIYNLGRVSLIQSAFITNGVIGGDGGNGGNAGNGSIRGGTAGSGGRGGSALGGVIFNAGLLTTTNCSFHGNFALGGFGGNGGSAGSGIFPGHHGRGAAGGGASGGAIHNQRNGFVTNYNTTFAFNVTDGSDSAHGGSNSGPGKSGVGGAHASGGGIANYGVQQLFNCTLYSNGANAGNGGTGSDGSTRGGTGGSGGSAWGGNIFNGRKSALIATHCTIADGGAVAGTNGTAGAGALGGRDGKPGASRGANISSSNGVVTLRNTIIADPVTGTNAYGKKFILQGRNISSDLSFKTYAKIYKSAITNLNPKLEALARNGGSVSTMRLLDDSPAINFATNNFDVITDARGIRRPYPVNGLPDVGAYEHGTYLTAPFIVTHPQNVTALRSNTVIFTVVAQGDPPLLYSWRKSNVAITNATSSILVLTRVTDADQADYDVVVSNNSGSVTSDDASLTVNIPAFITRQPTNLFISPGGTAVFSVVAEGDGTLSYQWRSNGVDILGASLSTYTITNVQPSFAAPYSVRIQGQHGTAATSSNAFLIVTSIPPAIVTQPLSTAVLAGRTATFTMEATGTHPLDFLLIRGGTNALNPISSYTGSATFTIPNAQPENAGSYYLVVTNYGGAATSSVVTLQVNVAPPTITQEPLDQTVAAGDNALFAVGVLASAPVLYQWFSNGVAVVNATNTFLSLTNLGTNASGSFSLFASNSAGFTNSRAAALVIATNLPPTIVTPPANVFAAVGDDVTLTVVAQGSRPFTYQWLFNGESLTNQTNVTLVLDNIAATNFGDYTVEVSNDFGTEISEPAVLSRLQTFNVDCDESNCEITVNNPVDDLYYTLQVWDGNAQEWLGVLETLQKLEDESLEPFEYTPVPFTDDENNYRVVVTEDEPDTEPGIIIDPTDADVLLGQDATFTTDGFVSSGPLSYRWFFQGTNLVAGQFGPTLVISNAQPDQAGPYNAVLYSIGGAATSAVAQLTVQFEPVTIVAEPADTTVYGTQTATFTVAATGSEPLSYQWFHNGSTPLVGATSATLILANVQSGDAGDYHAVVSNYFGAEISAAATLTVLDASIAITSQPASIGVYSGYNATFAVTNTGLAPVSYQWYFNSTNPVSGATSRVLNLTNVQSANDGTYQVVITNAAGAVTSSPAALNVTNAAPLITSQPPDLQVPAGTEITLTIGAIGSIPMTFQWYHTPIDEFGVPTSGPIALTNGTSATLILPVPDIGQEARWEGFFSVAITNAFGGTISSEGTVNIEGYGVPP